MNLKKTPKNPKNSNKSTSEESCQVDFKFTQDGGAQVSLDWTDYSDPNRFILALATLMFGIHSGRFQEICLNMIIEQCPEYSKQILKTWNVMESMDRQNNFGKAPAMVGADQMIEPMDDGEGVGAEI